MNKYNPFKGVEEPKLTIELVPFGTWFDNVRARLKKSEWDTLKRACYIKAGYVCEICGGKGKNHPVECHEIWSYNDRRRIQTLTGLISLCPACHRVKHIGNAQRIGLYGAAIRHLAKVNGWPIHEAEAYAEVSLQIWQIRSSQRWQLNLTWLDDWHDYVQAAHVVSENQKTYSQRAVERALANKLNNAFS